jgi:hypothetical protein
LEKLKVSIYFDMAVVGMLAIIFAGSAAAYALHDAKKKKAKENSPSSFKTRRLTHEAEAHAALEYQESIEAAFKLAREEGLLITDVVTYKDIERDKYLAKDKKTSLTRFVPVMTQELAEKIREWEIEDVYGEGSGTVALCLRSRQIKWIAEEVPEELEPINLKEKDRIRYPEISTLHSTLPSVMIEAARKMLEYDWDYVQREADARRDAKYGKSDEVDMNE